MMSEEQSHDRSFPEMKPRDILTPVATLLALSIASIALIGSVTNQNPSIVKNFAKIMIGVVVIFVATAVFTSMASLLGRESIWKAAVVMYIVGWIYLGIVLLILFIGYATGIESFQLPDFNAAFTLGISYAASIVSLIVAIITIFWQLRGLAKKTRDLTTKIKADHETVKLESARVFAAEGKDLDMSFIRMVIEVETKLREIALSIEMQEAYVMRLGGRQLASELLTKKVIAFPVKEAIDKIWQIRNMVVHGRVVSKAEVRAGFDLASTVLVALENIRAHQEA